MRRLKNFSTADLERLKTQLRPGQVHDWIKEVTSNFISYSLVAHEMASIYPADLAERGELTLRERAVNQWAARQALNTLDQASDYVANLMTKVRNDAPAARSCIVTLFRLASKATELNAEGGRRAKADFDGRKFFKVGESHEKLLRSAAELRNEFMALPAEYRCGSNPLIRALLSHMPSLVSDQRKRWEDELLEAEHLGSPLKWSFTQLAGLFAQQMVCNASRGDAREVNFAGRGGGRGSGAGKGGGKGGGRGGYGGGGRGGGNPSSDGKCRNCGQAGCYSRTCQKSCATCGNKSCRGTRGERCQVHSSTPITSPTNALGYPLPQHVTDKLVKAQREWLDKAGRGGGTTTKADRSTARRVLAAYASKQQTSELKKLFDSASESEE